MEIAWPLAQLGQPERAARIFGAAITFLQEADISLERTEEVYEQRVRKILREQLEAHEVDAPLDQGRNTPLEPAVRDALDESTTGDSNRARAATERATTQNTGLVELDLPPAA